MNKTCIMKKKKINKKGILNNPTNLNPNDPLFAVKTRMYKCGLLKFFLESLKSENWQPSQ